MKQYLNEWKAIEGSLVTQRIKELPDCLEKDHLFQIREMLKKNSLIQTNFSSRVSNYWSVLL